MNVRLQYYGCMNGRPDNELVSCLIQYHASMQLCYYNITNLPCQSYFFNAYVRTA
jgi:hypothetical protein